MRPEASLPGLSPSHMRHFTKRLALTGLQGVAADGKSREGRHRHLYVCGHQQRRTTGEPGSQGVCPG